mgnify:CR=1 FL=1
MEELAAATVPAAARRLAQLAVSEIPPDFSRATVSATALADYEHCPALFHYRHHLGLGQFARETPDAEADATRQRVPATAIGDVVHQYLCEADFSLTRAEVDVLARLASQHPAVEPGCMEC